LQRWRCNITSSKFSSSKAGVKKNLCVITWPYAQMIHRAGSKGSNYINFLVPMGPSIKNKDQMGIQRILNPPAFVSHNIHLLLQIQKERSHG